jgi:MFS family permease
MPGVRSIGLIGFGLILIPALAFLAVTLPLSAEGQVSTGFALGSITFLTLVAYAAAPVVVSGALASIFWRLLRQHRFLTFLAGGLIGTLILYAAVNFWLALMLAFLPSAISAIIALDWRDAALQQSRKTDG